jgi:hypothetical protein
MLGANALLVLAFLHITDYVRIPGLPTFPGPTKTATTIDPTPPASPRLDRPAIVPGSTARAKPAPARRTPVSDPSAAKPAPAVADSQSLPPPTPGEVLEGHGLKRVGDIYVLEAEADILQNLREIDKQFAELKVAYRRKDAVEKRLEDIEELRFEKFHWETDLKNHEAAMAAMPRTGNNEIIDAFQAAKNRQTEMKFEIHERDREIGVTKREIDIAGGNGLVREFDNKRERFRRATGNLRSRFDRMISRYEAIKKDDAAIKAVGSIAKKSGRRVELGPTKELITGLDQLKKYQAMVSGE